MANQEKKDEQPFDQLARILQSDELTTSEFTELANKHPDDAMTNEMSKSQVGGMSHFNCLYQMRLALISRLHTDLKDFKPKKIGDNKGEDDGDPPVELSEAVTESLCANFDLLYEVIRTDPSAATEIIKILLDSIGKLDLNALNKEPTKPLNKLEDILKKLLVEATSGGDELLSRSDQEMVFATAVELALTRASAPRLLAIIETLLTCIQSAAGSSDHQLSFPLPRTLLTLATKVRSFTMHPPHEELLVDSWTVEDWKSTANTTTTTTTGSGTEMDIMGSMVSNGQYLFIHGHFGLMKVGTGYHGTIKSKVYARNKEFYPDQHGCLVVLLDPVLKLLFRSKCIEPRCFVEIDPLSLRETEALEFGDSSYFKSSDGEYYNGEWLQKYSPSFSNGKYLSVVKLVDQTGEEKDLEIEIAQFDPSNRYAYTQTVKVSGPINLGSSSVGGCYAAGGNMQGEFGLGDTSRKDKVTLLEWTSEVGGSFKQIASGNQWHAYVTTSGDLWVAGYNSSGQFGLGNSSQQKIAVLHEWYQKKGKVKMVSSGTYGDHMLVLMENGDVYSHGAGYNSVLGIGENSSKIRPEKVHGLDGVDVVFVSADNKCSVFIASNGDVYTCGYDDYGTLGHGRGNNRVQTPKKIECLEGIKIVAAANAYTHMLLLDDRGEVYSCGQNSYGQLGLGHRENRKDPPTKIEFFSENGKKVKKVSAGYYHSGVICTDGTLYMFGYGSNYALGTDKSGYEPTPVTPEFFADKKVVDICCGGFHTVWLTDKNELYSSGNNSYGECMVGRTGTQRKPALCEELKEQNIASISCGLYTTVVQTENTEPAMTTEALQKATFMAGPDSVAMTVPSGVRMGLTDPKDLKFYDDEDGTKPEVDISALQEPRMRMFSGSGLRMMHHRDIKVPTNSKDGNAFSDSLTEATVSNKVSCFEAMTNSMFVFDPKHGIVSQYFSLPAPSNGKGSTAREILASPSTPSTILIHPRFAIPSTAGDPCDATRVVVALIAQLDLMADQQAGDWRKFVIGQNEDAFAAMFGILDQCWSFLKNASSSSEQDSADKDQFLFYGSMLQCIFGLLQVNIEHLPSAMFEKEGVALSANQDPSLRHSRCAISLPLSRSIGAEVGDVIKVRANDREIAVRIEECHGDDDEVIHLSASYGLCNLGIEDGHSVSVEAVSTIQATKVISRVIAQDLRLLPVRFRTADFIKTLYVDPFFKKKTPDDTVITDGVCISIHPMPRTKIDFEDEAVKRLQIEEDDEELSTLSVLRFKIKSVEPTSNTVRHFVVNKDCALEVELKKKDDDSTEKEKKEDEEEVESDEVIYAMESYRKIKQGTMQQLCDLLEDILTEPKPSKHVETMKSVQNAGKELYEAGYRAFFTTSQARCSHLLRCMQSLLGTRDQGGGDREGTEALLTTAIEIIKTTPEVSCLFYPKVIQEKNKNARMIAHDQLDEEEADAWLARFEKSEQTRAEFLDLWSSADVEGTGRITMLQLQRILKLKEDDDLMAEFKEEVGDHKLDFYDYAKLALRQRRGIYVVRPTWAKKKDLDAAQRTFIPAVSAETIQHLLSFVDRHTISTMDAMIESKAAVKGQDSTDAETQNVALKLVVAVLNDLIRRSLAANRDGNKPLNNFPPLQQFISMVFESTFSFLRRARKAQSLLSASSGLAIAGRDSDTFTAYSALHPAMVDLIMGSNTLKVILPYLVTNLTILISNGWTHIRDLGQLALNLLSEMHGLTDLLIDDKSESDSERKVDDEDDDDGEGQSNGCNGLDSEISMMVESEHPYEGAKQRCYKCVLPDKVSFIVVEFDKQCLSTQPEDYVELFSGDMMSTKVFDRYSQKKWPSSALIVPGNKVRVEFNTVSDYNDVPRQEERWGFRATVKGYIAPENLPSAWMVDLEKQVGYLGGLCASRLISSNQPRDTERKIAHVLRSVIFEKGMANHYLQAVDGSLSFTARSKLDRYLQALVAEPETQSQSQSKSEEEEEEEEKGGGKLINPEMATSGPHILVDWMRRQRGGVEQLKSSAIGDGIDPDDVDKKWVGWVTGFPRRFSVVTCDEFGNALDYGGAKIRVECVRGSVLGREVSGSADFSGELEIEDLSEDYPLPWKASQLASCRSNDGDAIYIFGGYKSDNRETNTVMKYDLDSQVYTDCAKMPGNMRGGEAQPLGNGKIAIAPTYPSDKVWIYDEGEDSWETLEKNDRIGWEASIALDAGGELHLLGGLNGYATHIKYDFEAKSWTKLKEFPEPRICGGMTLGPDGNLYAFGGCNARSTSNLTDKLYIYDADKDEWTEGAPMPKKLVCFAYCNTGQQILVFGGGSSYGNDSEPAFDDIYVYSFADEKWTTSEAKMPKVLREHDTAFVRGEIHIFGGSHKRGKQDIHFVVRCPGGAVGGETTIRRIGGRSPKEPVDFVDAVIEDHEDGTYAVQTTINESGIFYLRVLVNDHPIYGSPFKVHVESSLSSKIEWDAQSDKYFYAEDYDFDAYFVMNNVREIWKDSRCALRGHSLINVMIRPRDRETTYKGICSLFIPKHLWTVSFPEETNETLCVLSNLKKDQFKAVRCVQIEDEFEADAEDKKEDETKEEKKEDDKEEEKEKTLKKVCYLSRDLEKWFGFGVSDDLLQPIADKVEETKESKIGGDSVAVTIDPATDDTVSTKEEEEVEAPKEEEKKADPKEESEDEDDEEEEEEKEDPWTPKRFWLSTKGEDRNAVPRIASLVYTVNGDEEDPGTDAFREFVKGHNVPITSGDTVDGIYHIAELRDDGELVLPFGFLDETTKIESDRLRSILSADDQCDKFQILDELELEPILEKATENEMKKMEEEEEEETKDEVKKELPEWLVTLRMLSPGLPIRLYAVAYRDNEKNPEKAANWLMDQGEKYMADHIKEFENSPECAEWNCVACTFLNKGTASNCEVCGAERPLPTPPPYLEQDHAFWKKKEDKKEEEKEDNDEEEELELTFGKCIASGQEMFFDAKPPVPPFRVQLLVIPKPTPYSPSANTPAARRAVRHVFAALLRHHGVISEAMTCTNFLETFGALQVQKSSHPLLNELARLWDVALAVKHELATQYDLKQSKKGSGGGSKSGSKQEFDSIASKLKDKVQKDLAQRSEEDLRRELIKFKVKIVPSERKEMEAKLSEFRLDSAVRGYRCVCGSRMVRMVAREIYGSSLSCDLCGADVRGTLLAYHCPEERNPAHPNGYDVCMDCANKVWMLDESDKDKALNADDDDPYTELAQTVVEKMTLCFQVYPTKKDFGSSVDALVGPQSISFAAASPQKFGYTEPASPPLAVPSKLSTAQRFATVRNVLNTAPPSKVPIEDETPAQPHLMRAVSAETKQDDNLFLASDFPLEAMTRTQSDKGPGAAPFGMLNRAMSTPNVNKNGNGFDGRISDAVQPTGRMRLSRVPDECEAHEVTQMIMYLVRKDVDPRDIRNALSERRLRAKQRIMGFRLFKSLFDNTTSQAIHQDFAWLLATAIRGCVFERMEDPKLAPPGEQKKSDIEHNEKWRRDDWDEKSAFDGETIIHFLRGIEGSGSKLRTLTQSAFQKLYTKITAIFRHDSSMSLNMGALGFLESWSIHFDTKDHGFLHDSQIFPVIRSLMSRTSVLDEGAVDDEKKEEDEIAVYAPSNLTLKCEIKVSTAQHRVNYMVDESTETFWQSAVNADNDQFAYNRRHETHWIQLIFQEEQKVKEIVFALDADRDTEYMPASFQVSIGKSKDDCESVCTAKVENRFTGWFSIKMLDCKDGKEYGPDSDGCIAAKFFWFKIPTIQNGQYEMRVRQLFVYGPDEKQEVVPDSYAKKLQRVQDSALDLFRRLVSRTFLPTAMKATTQQNVEQKQSESASESKTDESTQDDGKEESKESDEIDAGIDGDELDDGTPVAPIKPDLLRQKTTEVQEEMVGILAFMGDRGQKVGNLQRLVFELIFSEIKKEMQKAEDSKRSFYDLEYDDPDLPLEERAESKKEKAATCFNDNYCFEMLCMILDLTSGKSGQKFIASPLLSSTLFQIFARGSTRMQDVLLSIFASIFRFVKPNVMKQFKFKDDSLRKYDNLIDFFLFCIASSLSSQIRGSENGKKYSKDLELKGWSFPIEQEQSKGIVKLLRKVMASEGIWPQIIKQRLIDIVLQTAELKEESVGLSAKAEDEFADEETEDTVASRDRFWLISSALAVIAGDTGSKHLDILNFSGSKQYQLDFREGNATIKVLVNNYPVIILVSDLTQCKSLITFRAQKADTATCRFCDRKLTEKNRATWTGDDAELKEVETLANVCNDDFCMTSARGVCQKRLPCGHLCCGIRGEETCLPCLEPDCDAHIQSEMKEDRDTYCNICYTDTLAAQPTILLESCGHAFHYECVKRMLELRYNGPRIAFGFRGCPLCKQTMRHHGLKALNEPLDKLYEAVKAKSLMRLKYEKLDQHVDITNEMGRFYNDPAGFAMNKYAYYMCYKCSQPYYGGEAACAAAVGAKNFDPSELLCPSCSPIRVEDCPKHGKDYIEFKCRYCCSIAVWFCFGTTHFCEPCHNNNGRLTSAKKEDLVPCPCKPKSGDRYAMPEALKDTDECPLGVKHPPHGEEYCLGCGLCRNKDF